MYKILLVIWMIGELLILLSIFTDLYQQNYLLFFFYKNVYVIGDFLSETGMILCCKITSFTRYSMVTLEIGLGFFDKNYGNFGSFLYILITTVLRGSKQAAISVFSN